MLDTSSLRRVDELQVEREQIEQIWTGIFALAESGRAMTVEPVYEELERGAPDTYKLLRQYRATPFMIRMTEQLRQGDVEVVQELCQSFPKLCRHSQHNRQAADPWLIAAAYTRNLTVVTEEWSGAPSHPEGVRVAECFVHCAAGSGGAREFGLGDLLSSVRVAGHTWCGPWSPSLFSLLSQEGRCELGAAGSYEARMPSRISLAISSSCVPELLVELQAPQSSWRLPMWSLPPFDLGTT